MPHPLRSLLLLPLLSLLGCFGHNKIIVESRPAGASLSVRERISSTPDEVRMPFYPFARRTVRVSAPGYRLVEVRLRRSWRRVEVILVPEHGPAGTWTPEDEGIAE